MTLYTCTQKRLNGCVYWDNFLMSCLHTCGRWHVTEYTQTTQLGVPEVQLITPTSYSLHKQSWYNDYKSHDCYLLKGQTVQHYQWNL